MHHVQSFLVILFNSLSVTHPLDWYTPAMSWDTHWNWNWNHGFHHILHGCFLWIIALTNTWNQCSNLMLKAMNISTSHLTPCFLQPRFNSVTNINNRPGRGWTLGKTLVPKSQLPAQPRRSLLPVVRNIAHFSSCAHFSESDVVKPKMVIGYMDKWNIT